MKTQTLAEWHAEMKTLFKSSADVAFICPACGHVATIAQHNVAGGDGEDAARQCIGRTTGRGTKDQTDKGDGCNWAAFGLLKTLGKGRKITFPNGGSCDVFDFDAGRDE